MAISKITSNSIDFSVGTSWQAVKTTNFTAVAGEGYFVNTTSGAITVTLPSSPTAGDAVVLKDYARTWGTNAVTIASALVDGATSSSSFSTSGQTVTIVYMDGTRGWTLVNEDTSSQLGPQYISATGGTVTTTGDYKIHTFTGDGCFVVSCGGNAVGSNTVDYLVLAGGGSGGLGGGNGGGGGGAGGFRESHSVPVSGCYTASPLATPTAIPVSATTYPIIVGGGGASIPNSGNGTVIQGNDGSNSVFSTITSTAGGGGAAGAGANPLAFGRPGGSGGGAGGGGQCAPGGTGNTPPVSPPQGNNGGSVTPPHSPDVASTGGGGAGGAGVNFPAVGVPQNNGTNGGIGVTSSISGSAKGYAGGGGGGSYDGPGPACKGNTYNFPNGKAATPGVAVCAAAAFGGGEGGNWNNPGSGGGGESGGINKGAGGGGTGYNSTGAGGSGIVIIRYKYQ